MPTVMINPDTLPVVDVYHQVAVATGTKLVFVAGQVSWDADGTTIGAGDLAAQVEQSYVNVHAGLAAAGGTFADVTRLTLYVVDWTPEKLPVLLEGIARARATLGITTAPPVTLIGVAALDVPEHLVEVEATAVLG